MEMLSVYNMAHTIFTSTKFIQAIYFTTLFFWLSIVWRSMQERVRINCITECLNRKKKIRREAIPSGEGLKFFLGISIDAKQNKF